MALHIQDHILGGDGVSQQTSPNTGGRFAAGQADTLVMHFTAGSSLQSSVNHLCKPAAGASAHLVVGRNGDIVQLVPFDTIAWHAGKSSWKGRSGLNKCAIGIELDNAGQLNANGQGQFLSWFGKAFSGEQVFSGVHRNQQQPSYWQAYTEVQIARTFELVELLCSHYGIAEVVGHEEISPGRKVDPGPAFPLDKLRQWLSVERAEEAPDDSEPPSQVKVVQAGRLNIRSGPGSEFNPVAEPLKQGDPVKVLEYRNGWHQVEFSIRGWISSQYIK